MSMRKEILAGASSVVLVAAFLSPVLSNDSFAQITSESRVLQAILGLTEVVKGQTENLVDATENIADDLLFKKKFYEFDYIGEDQVFFVAVEDCNDVPSEACAFNVESIQFSGEERNIAALVVDGVLTDISGKNITSPTNLLVDMGQGKIGASRYVTVFFPNGYLGPLEFNGEKPQGIELCTFPREVGGESNGNRNHDHFCPEDIRDDVLQDLVDLGIIPP
jgi:hypothetical protein